MCSAGLQVGFVCSFHSREILSFPVLLCVSLQRTTQLRTLPVFQLGVCYLFALSRCETPTPDRTHVREQVLPPLATSLPHT